jgi:hypothetical protein
VLDFASAPSELFIAPGFDRLPEQSEANGLLEAEALR